MHEAMALDFSGDAALDFVRGMIPHHRGAADMCSALADDLACVANDDDLDGLVAFCNEVHYTQDIEIDGMRRWLDLRSKDERAPCADRPDGHSFDGCGALTSDASVAFVAANRAMHGGMAVDLSCDHGVDFARMMIPHHAGAVAMCEVLADFETDPYLDDLCANVTRAQRAEVAWLHFWLEGRGHAIAAPCSACADDPDPPATPCEDMLSSSLLCSMARDPISCDCAVLLETYGCDDVLDGVWMAVSNECARSCGDCPADRPPLFYDACPGAPDDDGHGGHDDDDDGHGGHHDDDDGHGDHQREVSAAARPSAVFWAAALASLALAYL
jgi:uncharacterized protein (DUF305 family)